MIQIVKQIFVVDGVAMIRRVRMHRRLAVMEVPASEGIHVKEILRRIHVHMGVCGVTRNLNAYDQRIVSCVSVVVVVVTTTETQQEILADL